jgi:hypothetical protein
MKCCTHAKLALRTGGTPYFQRTSSLSSNDSWVLCLCPTPQGRAYGPSGLSLRPPVRRLTDIPDVSRFSCRKCLGVSGVPPCGTTQGRPGTRAIAPGHVAFRRSESVGVLIATFSRVVHTLPFVYAPQSSFICAE